MFPRGSQYLTCVKAYFFRFRGLFIATAGAAAFLRRVALRFAGLRFAALRFAGLRFAALRAGALRAAFLRAGALRFAAFLFFGIWFTSLHRSDDPFEFADMRVCIPM